MYGPVGVNGKGKRDKNRGLRDDKNTFSIEQWREMDVSRKATDLVAYVDGQREQH